jgi:hypothetical protein
MFGMLGGVRLYPELRNDHLRSTGVFQHTLTAGTIGGTLVPLFLLLWKRAKATWIALVGLAGCTLMTITSHSSTPLLAYAFSFLGLAFWPIRNNMRFVRWAIVIFLIVLNFTMKAPVWFVIAHVDLTGGSSGWHRAELIDQFFRHFKEWWLLGTDNTDSWGFDMWDAQNQYVQVGDQGGLLALVWFIAMISHCYKRLGLARKSAKSNSQKWGIWCLGATLLATCSGFFGVNYFDQSRVVWFLLLAIICCMTAKVSSTPAVQITRPLVEWSPIADPVRIEGTA